MKRLSVNDADYIRAHFCVTLAIAALGQPPAFIRGFARGVMQKCGSPLCVRRRGFEVARNSHPRNANYIHGLYEWL